MKIGYKVVRLTNNKGTYVSYTDNLLFPLYYHIKESTEPNYDIQGDICLFGSFKDALSFMIELYFDSYYPEYLLTILKVEYDTNYKYIVKNEYKIIYNYTSTEKNKKNIIMDILHSFPKTVFSNKIIPKKEYKTITFLSILYKNFKFLRFLIKKIVKIVYFFSKNRYII